MIFSPLASLRSAAPRQRGLKSRKGNSYGRTNDLQIAKVYWTQLGHEGHEEGERKRAQQALDQAKGHLRSLVGHKAGLRLTPQLQFVFDEVPGEAHEIEDILAVAKKRDEELARARATAQYAGDADPYKHDAEPSDDFEDDSDEE